MIIKHKQEKIEIRAKKVSFFGKFVGLMFKSRDTANLLFVFRRQKRLAIHSCFVFFPFLAIWLDEKNNVVGYNFVKPFSRLVKSGKAARKLLELPFNKKNDKIFELFVAKAKI